MAASPAHEEVAACDALRDPEQATEPDARCTAFAVVEAAGVRKATLADNHEDIRCFVLNDAVPHSIRVHFETAKNLYLYAWFVFRFYAVAEQQALTSLEFALRERLLVSEKGSGVRRGGKGLAARLQQARELGLISNEGLRIRERMALRSARQRHEFGVLEQMIRSGATEMVLDDSNIEPNEQDLSHDWIGTFVQSLPMIRNEYAHGSGMLYSTVLGSFEIVCDLINQLYPKEN